MRLATCPDCHQRRVVVLPHTSAARIRKHTARDGEGRMTLCPGSGRQPLTSKEV